jgi:hypothetical protein
MASREGGLAREGAVHEQTHRGELRQAFQRRELIGIGQGERRDAVGLFLGEEQSLPARREEAQVGARPP